VWFDRDGKPLGQVGAPGPVSAFAISPDGGTVAEERSDPHFGTYDLWLHDLARGAASRFTFDPKTDFLPVWSPDGSRIAFGSNRDGPVNLYQKAASGAEEEDVLLQSPQNKRPTDWSRDGRFLIFDKVDSKTKLDIWVLPLSVGRSPVPGKPFPFLRTEFNEQDAKLSPDGRWLVYVSDETGRHEIYAQTFPTPGGKYQVSTGGGIRPAWSRDGKELFYITADRKLTAIQVKTGAKFEAGAAKPLLDVGPDAGGFFDISPDGRRFLLNKTVEEPTAPLLTVVVNWRAGVKN
jgi:Tol biopolymer transport system component